MAQDRSPESFSPQMNSTSLFLWFKFVTPGVGPVFIPRGIIWIKLTKVYKEMLIPNVKALILPVSGTKNFEVGFLCSYVPTCDPSGGASFDPRSIIWTNLVEVHKEMLKTKYQSSMPSSFIREEFWRWDSLFLCSNFWPAGWVKSSPQEHHMNRLGRGPLEDATLQISKFQPLRFGTRRFLKFFLSVAMATRVLHRIHIFEVFWKCITQGSFLWSFMEICWPV